MVQVLQIKRRVTGPGNPATLLPGEPSYNTTGHTLVIGDDTGTVQNLVSPNRQVELAGAQAITGPKTIPVANLLVPGGVANQFLRTTNPATGALVFADVPLPPFASDPNMDALAPSTTLYVNPANVRSLVGGQLSSLATADQTGLIPAINALQAAIDLIAVGQVFVGIFDATTGTITWTAASGGAGGLPAPGPGNAGWYLICTVAGTNPAGFPAGTYGPSDWVISNGVVWTHLDFSSAVTAVTADNVSVTPAVLGAVDVQSALEALAAANLAQDAVIALKADITYVDAQNAAQDAANVTALDGKVDIAGDTMTGPLLLPLAAPTIDVHAANKKYVDDTVAGAVGGASVLTDGVSILGNGLLGTELEVGLIDCGTY